MIDTVIITIFTTASLRSRISLTRLLDALEDMAEFTPLKWGLDERAKLPYQRQSLIDQVTELDNDFYIPGIRRSKKIAYSGYFSAKCQGMNYLRVDFKAMDERFLRDVFLLGDKLAEALPPEFGFVHPVTYDKCSQEYGAAGAIDLNCFENFGPVAVCARTWFGKGLANLIGRDVFARCGAVIENMPLDVVCLDLAYEPWKCSIETLMACQLQVMNTLKQTGVFGDYSDLVDYKAGPRFSPVWRRMV